MKLILLSFFIAGGMAAMLSSTGRIVFDLQNEGRCKLIAGIMDAEQYITSDMPGIFSLPETRDVTYENAMAIFDKSKVEVIHWTLLAFQSLQIPAHKTYKDLEFNRHINFSSVLKSLHINQTEFERGLAVNNYTILHELNYGEALYSMRMSGKELYDFLQPIFLNRTRNLNLISSLNILPNQNRAQFLGAAFEILRINCDVGMFKEISESLKRGLNNQVVIGTGISKYNFITTGSILPDSSLGQYLKLSLTTDSANYMGGDVIPHKSGYLNATTARLENYVKVAKKYKDVVRNCTYINEFKNFQLINVTLSENLEIDMAKEGISKFTPGAPIICDKYLYGVAAVTNNTHINFITFVNTDTIFDAPPPNSASGISWSLPICLVMFFTCLFI